MGLRHGGNLGKHWKVSPHRIFFLDDRTSSMVDSELIGSVESVEQGRYVPYSRSLPCWEHGCVEISVGSESCSPGVVPGAERLGAY